MKQNLIYLTKGLLFSTLIMACSTLLLAFLMMKTGWGDTVMFPLLVIAFCLSAFLGGRYFAKHTETRRFLWGIGFGAAFFAVYVIVSYVLSPTGAPLSGNALTFLISAVASGCVGGMLS